MATSPLAPNAHPHGASPPLESAPPASGHAAAHALDIDFVRRRRRLSPLGALLLAAGVLVSVAVALDYEEAEQLLDPVRQQHARLQRVSAPAATVRRAPLSGLPALPALPGAAAQAGGATGLQAPLQRPWDVALRGIEEATEAAHGSVALLSLEAQGATGLLRLSGEARAMPEVVAYVQRLRGVGALRGVELSGHEWREVQGTPLLRFVLDLRWSAMP